MTAEIGRQLLAFDKLHLYNLYLILQIGVNIQAMDKKAKNILFKTYWKNGWIDPKLQQVAPADFAYAKSMGLMFDPLTISHDECVEEILTILPTITVEKVISAFLSSLSTRQLELRSGLASYFIAQQIPPHKYDKVVSGHGYHPF